MGKNVNLELRRKRILFRACNRGMRETELILRRFFEKHLHTLTEDQLTSLENLINEGDADLFAWITGKTPLPNVHDQELMFLIQKFNNEF